MTSTVFRALRRTGKTLRRNASAAVAVVILIGLVGTTLAGAIIF